MKQQKRFSPPVVGGSSLLIIFAVLCLTMFTLLALSTAKANIRLSDASVQAVSDYYEADRQAEQILCELRKDPSQSILYNVQVDDDVYSYSVPISETQMLMVEVKIEKDSWQVLRWQSVSTSNIES